MHLELAIGIGIVIVESDLSEGNDLVFCRIKEERIELCEVRGAVASVILRVTRVDADRGIHFRIFSRHFYGENRIFNTASDIDYSRDIPGKSRLKQSFDSAGIFTVIAIVAIVRVGIKKHFVPLTNLSYSLAEGSFGIKEYNANLLFA